MSAKPWCTIQLSARMPSEAILRPSTQTPTCSRSSPGLRVDAERRERVDHDLLEVVRVAPQVLAVIAQIEDRVADELARAVPGGAASAVGAQDLPAERAVGVLAARQLGLGVGRPAERERGGCSQSTIVSGTAPCERAAARSSCRRSTSANARGAASRSYT